MRHLSTVAAFAAIAAGSPAASQQLIGIDFRPTFDPQWSLYGCGAYSCHLMQVAIWDPADRVGLWEMVLGVQSWYLPGGSQWGFGFGFEISDLNQGSFNSIGQLRFAHYMGDSAIFWAPIGWSPTTATVASVIGPAGSQIDEASDLDNMEYVDLTLTPEPASLLLLGTGLAGVVGAARCRRKRGRHGLRSRLTPAPAETREPSS